MHVNRHGLDHHTILGKSPSPKSANFHGTRRSLRLQLPCCRWYHAFLLLVLMSLGAKGGREGTIFFCGEKPARRTPSLGCTPHGALGAVALTGLRPPNRRPPLTHVMFRHIRPLIFATTSRPRLTHAMFRPIRPLLFAVTRRLRLTHIMFRHEAIEPILR